MKRLQLLAAELVAFFVLWGLWDLRVALTLIVLLVVVHAILDERRERRRPQPNAGDVPTLHETKD